MSAYIQKTDTENKSMLILHKFRRLEEFLLPRLGDGEAVWNYKQLNETALASGIKSSSVKNIKTLVCYWTIKGYIKKGEHTNTNQIHILPSDSKEHLLEKAGKLECIRIYHPLSLSGRERKGHRQ